MKKLLTMLVLLSCMSCSDFKKGWDDAMAEDSIEAASPDSTQVATPTDSLATDSIQ